ncbi:hypothetical protein V491_00033 [Pseudogymnoascus sp. VKM F-3775]|nr:hypothetical protein V491_00033 [Pseudogymnoascus sp. VKM F-3775]
MQSKSNSWLHLSLSWDSLWAATIDSSFIDRSRFWLDIGRQVTPPDHFLKNDSVDLAQYTPETYLWRRCCLNSYIQLRQLNHPKGHLQQTIYQSAAFHDIHGISGYRLLREEHTLIVALMRGGEPMAFGVNEAFPLATFVHAKEPTEMRDHLQGRTNIVLVDSVVNSGKTVVQFVQYIRNLDPTIRIVVVTGVAQADSISIIEHALPRERHLSVIALRLSANKFTGKGPTDTGNRLYNTTHLP